MLLIFITNEATNADGINMSFLYILVNNVDMAYPHIHVDSDRLML